MDPTIFWDVTYLRAVVALIPCPSTCGYFLKKYMYKYCKTTDVDGGMQALLAAVSTLRSGLRSIKVFFPPPQEVRAPLL
eukprot:3577102-Pleurochrysis_carterae.AAC.1